MRKVLPVLILISLEGQKEEADVLLRLFAFADSSHLARLRLPRFQRLISSHLNSWASQRLSAQLSPRFYLLRLRRMHFGPGYDRCCPSGTRWQTFRNSI